MERKNPLQNRKLARAAITLLVVLAALAALALTKPDRDAVSASLSENLIENAGNKYSEIYNDFFFLKLASILFHAQVDQNPASMTLFFGSWNTFRVVQIVAGQL